MASTKYPIRTMRIPPWMSLEQAAAHQKQIYFNWRQEQRPMPISKDEEQHAESARIGEPVLPEFWIDYRLLQFLKSITAPIPMLVLHQG